jgi:hypothetical protein
MQEAGSTMTTSADNIETSVNPSYENAPDTDNIEMSRNPGYTNPRGAGSSIDADNTTQERSGSTITPAGASNPRHDWTHSTDYYYID